MKRVILGVLLVLLTSRVFAVELRLNAEDPTIEKIKFSVAVETAKLGVETVDQQVVMTSGAELESTAAYASGDVYYLSGNLDAEWSKEDWERYFWIARWLVKKQFRVIMNPIANEKAIIEAIQNPKVSIIIWSSHGDKQGIVYDTDSRPISLNAFSTDVSPSLKQIVFSNCNGEKTVANYSLPLGVHIKHWVGDTTNNEMFQYLYSNEWELDFQF